MEKNLATHLVVEFDVLETELLHHCRLTYSPIMREFANLVTQISSFCQFRGSFFLIWVTVKSIRTIFSNLKLHFIFQICVQGMCSPIMKTNSYMYNNT